MAPTSYEEEDCHHDLLDHLNYKPFSHWPVRGK